MTAASASFTRRRAAATLALALARPQSRRIGAALNGARAAERETVEKFLKAMVNPELRVQIDKLPAGVGPQNAEENHGTDDLLADPSILKDDAPHLLVIDDDTRIRTLLKQYLTENGFRVSVAGNADEARRKLAGLDFDLLIVDVMMPGESGVDLTRSLRADRRRSRS